MACPYAIRVKMLVKPLAFACLIALAPTSGIAAPHLGWAQDGDQQAASRRRLSGSNLPSKEIERLVVPTVKGAQYLGFDFDPLTDVYTLKFLRNGSVIWLDVDGHTGRIIRRTGN